MSHVLPCSTRSGGVDYHMDPKAGEKVPFFLNRLMVMPTYDQELMFTFFSSTLEAIIQVSRPLDCPIPPFQTDAIVYPCL